MYHLLFILGVIISVSEGNQRASLIFSMTWASHNFSQFLYQEIALNKSNVCYSPFGIHMTLTMTSAGARGDTEDEMLKTLGITNPLVLVTGNYPPHLGYQFIIETLNNNDEVRVLTANGIFVNRTRTINSGFINDLFTYYSANVSRFDLAANGGPEQEVNDFVEKNTEGLITDFLQPGTINCDTKLILINIPLFNGTWKTPFPAGLTKKRSFFTLKDGTIQVDMMNDVQTINIKRTTYGVDVAELPCTDERYVMYIVLPQDVDGITELERNLTIPGRVDDFFNELTPTRTNISIPKVKIESTNELSSALKKMGMVKAFDPQRANFLGISNAGDVYINKMHHKAKIEFTEIGPVVEAATDVVIAPVSAPQLAEEYFYADHPFLFFLKDKSMNLILLQGKCSG